MIRWIDPDDKPEVLTALTWTSHEHRRVFIKRYGATAPWKCHFCGSLIHHVGGNGVSCLEIHHLDQNTKNNDPTNLVPTHSGCHHEAHSAGRITGPRPLVSITGDGPGRVQVKLDHIPEG